MESRNEDGAGFSGEGRQITPPKRVRFSEMEEFDKIFENGQIQQKA